MVDRLALLQKVRRVLATEERFDQFFESEHGKRVLADLKARSIGDIVSSREPLGKRTATLLLTAGNEALFPEALDILDNALDAFQGVSTSGPGEAPPDRRRSAR